MGGHLAPGSSHWFRFHICRVIRCRRKPIKTSHFESLIVLIVEKPSPSCILSKKDVSHPNLLAQQEQGQNCSTKLHFQWSILDFILSLSSPQMLWTSLACPRMLQVALLGVIQPFSCPSRHLRLLLQGLQATLRRRGVACHVVHFLPWYHQVVSTRTKQLGRRPFWKEICTWELESFFLHYRHLRYF